MTEHDTHVDTRSGGHLARCRCGWSVDCENAPAAVWACWDHVRAGNAGPKEMGT